MVIPIDVVVSLCVANEGDNSWSHVVERILVRRPINKAVAAVESNDGSIRSGEFQSERKISSSGGRLGSDLCR